MLALALFGAAFVCLVTAFFFRTVPTDEELEDNERVRRYMWLPNGIIMIIASFYAFKHLGNRPPKLSTFAILIFVCLGFMVAGGVALWASGTSGVSK